MWVCRSHFPLWSSCLQYHVVTIFTQHWDAEWYTTPRVLLVLTWLTMTLAWSLSAFSILVGFSWCYLSFTVLSGIIILLKPLVESFFIGLNSFYLFVRLSSGNKCTKGPLVTTDWTRPEKASATLCVIHFPQHFNHSSYHVCSWKFFECLNAWYYLVGRISETFQTCREMLGITKPFLRLKKKSLNESSIDSSLPIKAQRLGVGKATPHLKPGSNVYIVWKSI